MGAALLGAAVVLITWPIKAMLIRRVNDQKSHKIVCFCAKIGLQASFLVHFETRYNSVTPSPPKQ